jgi:hypothetical protein
VIGPWRFLQNVASARFAEVDRLARAYTGELNGIELLDRKVSNRCARGGLPNWEAARLTVET